DVLCDHQQQRDRPEDDEDRREQIEPEGLAVLLSLVKRDPCEDEDADDVDLGDHFAATWLRFMLNGPGLPGSNSRSAGGNTCVQLSPPSVDTAMRGSLKWGSTPHATIAPSAVAAATASGKN